MKKLIIPLDEESVRDLHAGDIVELSGEIFCARDMAHEYYFKNIKNSPNPNIKGSVIYHCGPLVKKTEKGYEIISAGPTTSFRMGSFLPEIIKEFEIKAVIGKGGLDKSLLKDLNKVGCVYLSVTGGAGALIADRIEAVVEVYHLEFGLTEAVWKIRVKSLPAVVTMDTHFRSIHEKILRNSLSKANKVF